MARKQFDVQKWLATWRKSGFVFRLINVVGTAPKIRYCHPPNFAEAANGIVREQVIAHKPALIAALEDEGRARITAEWQRRGEAQTERQAA